MAYIGNIPAVQYASFSKQTLTADSSTTSFTLDNAVANENELEVFVNNVRQEPGSGKAYTASGTTLAMSAAPTTGDSFYVIFQGKATQTVTAPSGSVTTSQLADSSVTTAKILDANITSAKLASGVLPTNTPAFFAELSATQTGVSDDTFVKVQFDDEKVDTDNAYDNSTNYRFTVPSGKAGKYYVTAGVDVDAEANSNLDSATIQIRKNGSTQFNIEYFFLSNPLRRVPVHTGVIMDLTESDYLEIYCRIEASDSTGGRFIGNTNGSFFGAYKLIGV